MSAWATTYNKKQTENIWPFTTRPTQCTVHQPHTHPAPPPRPSRQAAHAAASMGAVTLPDRPDPTADELPFPVPAVDDAAAPPIAAFHSLDLAPELHGARERQPASAPALLTSRRSVAHTRRMSGAGGGTGSHFSKPVEFPSGAEIVAVDDEEVEVEVSVPKTTKSGNTLKKQITKVVPHITKIAPSGGRHRKKVKDGQVVFKGHPSWEIVLSIQFGLRYTSELLQSSEVTEPTPQDFRESLAFDFDPAGDQQKSSMFAINKFAKWVHPAPFVYRLIRTKFGVSEEKFLEATCSESRVRELPTPGKSGALFYITEDENYFMKTITGNEEKMLTSMLPTYYEHISNNPNTLLTKYLAHFSVQTTRNHHIRMVVMASIFNDQIYIDKKFDLKGSTFKRYATPSQLESENVTLKDLDFEAPIYFRPDALEQLIGQLTRDSAYLESHSVMDYSLLLGLSEMLPEEDQGFKHAFGQNEESAPYYLGYQLNEEGVKVGQRISLGIIDFLQRFRLRKKVEYGCRVMQSCSCSSASVAPPSLYRQRFLDFLREKLLPDPDLNVNELGKQAPSPGENDANVQVGKE